MRKELSLEHAAEQGIRFLSANDDRKPVILQIGRADIFDSPNGDRPLRRDGELTVDEALHNDVDVLVGLSSVSFFFRLEFANPKTYQNEHTRRRLARSPKLGHQQFTAAGKQHGVWEMRRQIKSGSDSFENLPLMLTLVRMISPGPPLFPIPT